MATALRIPTCVNLLACLCLLAVITKASDFAAPCYNLTLPSLAPSGDNRTVPWGAPDIAYANGTTCCSSLDEVRAGIDAVDEQLLGLLAMRAAYVREATRFKATVTAVDDPVRDAQVVQGAEDGATAVRLPQTIAQGVFQAILDSSIGFETCVFNEYDSYGS